jgi:hypothetical protein
MKILEELECAFCLLKRSWWAGFNGIYLVRFGFRLWEMMIFKWFLPLKIQINSKKSVEDVVTLGPMAQATLVPIIYMLYIYWVALWTIKLSTKHHPYGKCP